MIILLSPAKTLDMQPVDVETTLPRHLTYTKELARKLQSLSSGDLQKLMKISENLGDLNYERFQKFSTPFNSENATAAGFAFQGDVYQDLEYHTLEPRQRELADRQIRILSGFYGILRPTDLMQAYRLEMGTKLKNKRGKDLYKFWGDSITATVNEDLATTGEPTVLNLASKEYFKSIDTGKLDGRLLNIHFKEKRDGKYKIIAFNAKKARGRLARLICLEGLTSPEGIKELVVNDYSYHKSLSSEDDWVFVK